tara:strand:- start:2570 stop:5119 length:2550 start_codon:yes stop_codon:yes gene_type:complete
MKNSILVAAAFAFGGSIIPVEAKNESLDSLVATFVENYCIDCHDDLTAKGDRDFLPFLDNPNGVDSFLALEEILDSLNLGEMPPEKNGVTQPSDDEKRAVITEITRYLIAESAALAPSETVLRRLTRYEYNNTMRDLLGVHPDVYDATTAFPVDETKHGFANVGASQVLSQYQLGLYLESAGNYLDQALVFGEDRPELNRFEIKPVEFSSSPVYRGAVAYRALAEDASFVDIGHGAPDDRRPNVPRSMHQKGVPAAGNYRITIKAEAKGRLDHGYDPELLGLDLRQPMKLGVWFGDSYRALEKSTTRGRNIIEVIELGDNKVGTYTVEAWMPKGGVPFINWINGPGASKRHVRVMIENYHPESTIWTPVRVDEMRERGIEVTDEEVERHNASVLPASYVYRGPRIRLYEMMIEGPLDEEWPPANHRKLVGDTLQPHKVDIPAAILKLANRAYRRPVKMEEIAHIVEYVEDSIEAGENHKNAIKSGFSAVLSSPYFLYLNEGNADRRPELNDYQLASRLSYFLWSSMPDDSLLAAAASGELRSREKLLAQVDRMLADPKAQALAENFTTAWLRLDKLGSMPPGTKQFPTYLGRRLEDAMRTETKMLFSHILKENRPLTEFIEADYTFVNDSLGQHYGFTEIEGEHFRKVAMPAELRRHGILGHASVLTASANGVETSPVVRGIWVLESVLGTPPSPPPPDVDPIEPDTRGTTTIREQLTKHREVAACNDCHAKIDPWGFALEIYDPIGGLRTHYPQDGRPGRGPEIDTSGELVNGDSFQDEIGLKSMILERKDLVARSLTTKLLTYGTGREPSFEDYEQIEKITSTTLEEGKGLNDLIHAVVSSRIFLTR